MARKLETIEDYQRAVSQGYGIGAEKNYKPWFRVKDVPSHGRSSKYQSLTVGRVHQTLSDLETRMICLADYNKYVIDIREQFPIFPLDGIQVLAKHLGIKYPFIPGTKTPVVMTTDFLLTLNTDGIISYLAVAVKPSEELRKRRVCEKLDLERVYWQSLGIEWVLATEIDLSETVNDNLVWISSVLKGHDNYLENFDTSLLNLNIEPRTYSIQALLSLVSDLLMIDLDEAKFIICKAIWQQKLEIELNQSIESTGLIKIICWNERGIISGGQLNGNIA